MPEKKSSSTIGVRLSSSVIDQLDELCKVSASRRSEIISNLIIAEYDRLQGNPKMKEIMQQMVELEQALKGLQVSGDDKSVLFGGNE